MNRLAPLIVRRPRIVPAAALAAAPAFAFEAIEEAPPASEELRLFVTSFLTGLVFFGTYLS